MLHLLLNFNFVHAVTPIIHPDNYVNNLSAEDWAKISNSGEARNYMCFLWSFWGYQLGRLAPCGRPAAKVVGCCSGCLLANHFFAPKKVIAGMVAKYEKIKEKEKAEYNRRHSGDDDRPRPDFGRMGRRC